MVLLFFDLRFVHLFLCLFDDVVFECHDVGQVAVVVVEVQAVAYNEFVGDIKGDVVGVEVCGLF